MEDFLEKLSGSEKIKEGKEKEPTKPIKKETEEGQLAVDVFQTENEIIVQSTIAGVKAEDLDITIQNDMVSIKGERKRTIDVLSENYFYQECYWGPFSRSIILPEEINANEAKAELKNGILTLHLPKSEKIKATKVGVKEVD